MSSERAAPFASKSPEGWDDHVSERLDYLKLPPTHQWEPNA